MVQENHIDKALAFMESLEKLGNQLKAAEEHQKQLIARMLDLKKENLTDGEEYAELSQKSKSLQDIIDKWRPIYLERMEMVKGVQKRKRTKKLTIWFFVLLDFSYTGVIFEIINKETTVKIKDPKLLAKKINGKKWL